MASANSGAEEDYMNFQTLKGRDEKFLDGETDYDAVEESSRRPIPEPRDGSPVKKTKQGTDQARLMSAGIFVDNRKILPIMLIILVLLVVTSIATLAYMLTRFQQYDAKLKAVGEITAPFKATSAAIVGKLQSSKDGTELLRGEKGDTGLKGAQGVMGASGMNGTDGADGMDGSPGEVGQKGEQGLQGQKGESGANGMKGQKGQMGSTASVTHGGVYTRWGYTSCGSSSSRLYYGIIGSTGSDKTGGGVDFLCLPTNPEWLSTSTSPPYVSWIGSVSYQHYGYIFSSSTANKRARCAQCYTNSRPAVMMIPGRYSCPSYWTRKYYGYLMASREDHNHPSRYICVNSSPSYLSYSSSSYVYNSGFLAFVKADCSGSGTLDECSSGEYVNGRVLSCVVCSR